MSTRPAVIFMFRYSKKYFGGVAPSQTFWKRNQLSQLFTLQTSFPAACSGIWSLQGAGQPAATCSHTKETVTSLKNSLYCYGFFFPWWIDNFFSRNSVKNSLPTKNTFCAIHADCAVPMTSLHYLSLSQCSNYGQMVSAENDVSVYRYKSWLTLGQEQIISLLFTAADWWQIFFGSVI